MTFSVCAKVFKMF